MISWELWIPLLWIIIIGTKPVSTWFGSRWELESPDGYLEGSPLDRNIFIVLLVLGLIVLLNRKVNWRESFASNRWLFAFFIYCGISVIWSDYPFVGLKRWVKDFGNVIMVMIILTEKSPVQAVRAVFARYTYIAIPLSVLFIKYFPDTGRYYNQWTWEPGYCGVTLEKNMLGAIAFVCGLFLVWDLLYMRGTHEKKTDRVSRFALLLMVLYLIRMADSSTSLVCLVLGSGILFLMRYPFMREKTRYLGTYSAIFVLCIIILYSVPGILESVVQMVGRNVTLTGRTDLWSDLLKMPINPVVGTGYQSFWLGERIAHMWALYSYRPNQAHNGFLEIYLNGGFIGAGLLTALIVSTGKKLKPELIRGNGYGVLQFTLFVIVLISNWTEATFNKQTLVWVIMIFSTMSSFPLKHSIPMEVKNNFKEGDFNQIQPTRKRSMVSFGSSFHKFH